MLVKSSYGLASIIFLFVKRCSLSQLFDTILTNYTQQSHLDYISTTMRSHLTKLSSPKPKPAQSQSPLHKKKFYKFVNDNANAKAEKSMQEQQLLSAFNKEPPKEKKEEFKVEIDRRFQKSLINHSYKFPRTEISSDSLSNDSRDSMDRLRATCNYDLHGQNLRHYAKQQRNSQKSASLGHQSGLRAPTGNQPAKGNMTERTADKNAKKAHSNEPIKNIIQQTIHTEGSETQNKILELLEKNFENASKASSVTTKVSDTSDKKQDQKAAQRDTSSNLNQEDQQENNNLGSSSKQKLSSGSSPKQINFSLNVHVSNTKVFETKNVYNINNIKNVNHFHSIQDSKAMSKSTKDLSSGLQTSRSPKFNMQSPPSGKKSGMSSAATTVTTMTTQGSTKTVKVPLENAGSLTASISLQTKEPVKKTPMQTKSNIIVAK